MISLSEYMCLLGGGWVEIVWKKGRDFVGCCMELNPLLIVLEYIIKYCFNVKYAWQCGLD